MSSRKIIVDSAGLPVTQHEYDALLRAVANLSALVVHLEDQLDELRAQQAMPPGADTVPESAQTPPDMPVAAEEGRSQSSPAASTAPTEIAWANTIMKGEGFAFFHWHRVRWPNVLTCTGRNACLRLWNNPLSSR